MKSAIVAELPPGRQHFFRFVCGCPMGLSDAENLASFFRVSSHDSSSESDEHLKSQIQAGWNVAARYQCAPKVTIMLLIRIWQYGVEIRSRARLRAGASHLQFGRLTLLFCANRFERSVLRRSVSNEWREIRFAGDQIRIVKFSFEHQRSRVAPHIAE